VITETAFEPIGAEAFGQAKEIMARCEQVICCTERFGTMNAGNQALKEHAASQGLLRGSEKAAAVPAGLESSGE
jgi:iron complex transport system ATP-binding protein